jgi:hypothetical protein
MKWDGCARRLVFEISLAHFFFAGFFPSLALMKKSW